MILMSENKRDSGCGSSHIKIGEREG
uniref:Uncharacterized protein n=1 Tax=Arundo donax TaxID=35708 RepID=A0A0A8Z0R6_ARUDO